jgi:CopG family nickel-responsive transcriptional regulator
MKSQGYENRSEAVRDLARLGLKRARIDDSLSGDCVFNHHTSELARRPTDARHDHRGEQVATMHVQLDHDSCLKVAVFRGDAAKVRDFAKSIIAERGVTHNQVSFVPVSIDADPLAWRRSPQTHSHPSENLVERFLSSNHFQAAWLSW